MRHSLLSVAVVAALTCSAANATTCHIVLDRTDTVIYRNIVPPVDLSERGSAARAAMRQRGEFLLMMESDQCASFVAQTGAAGAGGASVDDIVAGLRSYAGAGGGGVMSSARAPAAAAPSGPAGPPGAPRSPPRAY